MFDRSDDPLYLQARLEAFIDRWHGHRKPWFGIAAEKIEQTQLPQPLAWLYGYAGEWQGRNYWDTLLGNQDCLLPFEELAIRDGKLVFVNENQGVWQVGTDSAGEDPRVWARIDGGPWQLLDDSLTRFLVTFVLHETVFGCQHLGSAENAMGKLTGAGLHVSAPWLNHPYPAFLNGSPGRSVTFHVANGTHLVMDNYWVRHQRRIAVAGVAVAIPTQGKTNACGPSGSVRTPTRPSSAPVVHPPVPFGKCDP